MRPLGWLTGRSRRTYRRLLVAATVAIPLLTFAATSFAVRFDGGPSRVFVSPDHRIAATAISPAGDELISLHASSLQADETFEAVEIWSLPDCKLRDVIERDKGCMAAAYSPCGRYVAVVRIGDIRVLDRKSMKDRFRIVEPGSAFIGQIAFSNHGRWLAADFSSGVLLWDLESETGELFLPTGMVRQFVFGHNDDELLLIRSSESKYACAVWNVAERKERFSFPMEIVDEFAPQFAFSNNFELAAAITSGGRASVWNIAQRRRIADFVAHPKISNGHPHTLCFGANDELLITSGNNERRFPMLLSYPPYFAMRDRAVYELKAWDIQSSHCVRTWRNDIPIEHLRPLPYSRSIVSSHTGSGDESNRLSFWQLPSRWGEQEHQSGDKFSESAD